jgi:hypothetical protein
MQITVTWQGIITTAAVIAAMLSIYAFVSKVVLWIDKQNQQEKEIERLKKHHDQDIKELKEEQTLLVEGILACLQGLQERGCNGPVSLAIEKYTNYLNAKAHQ